MQSDKLSPEGLNILALSAAGMTSFEIAPRCRMTVAEVRSHLAQSIRALGARSKLEAVLQALSQGLIDLSLTDDLQVNEERAPIDAAPWDSQPGVGADVEMPPMRPWGTEDRISHVTATDNHDERFGRVSRIGAAFLVRLGRLLELRSSPQLTRIERRFVDHALYTTYWDCAAVGARSEALVVLGVDQMHSRTLEASEIAGGRRGGQCRQLRRTRRTRAAVQDRGARRGGRLWRRSHRHGKQTLRRDW